MNVIPLREKFGIELLLPIAEAIAAGPGSHGYRVPKVIVRLVRARKLHVSVVLSRSLEHSATFLVRKSGEDLLIKLSLHFGRSCPMDTRTGHTT